jgi:hypothetical protein
MSLTLSPVILWGSYINGFLCGLFGYLYVRCKQNGVFERHKLTLASHRSILQFGGTVHCVSPASKPTRQPHATYSHSPSPIILFSFLIGINLSFTIGSALDAGVSTIFVGLGEHPM